MRSSFFLKVSLICIGGFAIAAYLAADDGTEFSAESTAKQVAEDYLAQTQVGDVQFRNLLVDGLGPALKHDCRKPDVARVYG